MDAVMPGLDAVSLPRDLPLDAEKFEEIYGTYKSAVCRFAWALAGRPGEAEDLFQETWLRAVRSWRSRSPRGDLKSWLFTITANLHRDGLRKKRIRRLFFLERARSMTDEASDADTGWDSGRFTGRDGAGRADLRICLRRAISRLPARQRQVFVLKDIEGYPHAEIGRMLGIPEATVRTLLHRAVRNLQGDLAAFRPGAAPAPDSEEKEP
jgi:RNA polymerase sigma-70 factor (ECF subfamily)